MAHSCASVSLQSGVMLLCLAKGDRRSAGPITGQRAPLQGLCVKRRLLGTEFPESDRTVVPASRDSGRSVQLDRLVSNRPRHLLLVTPFPRSLFPRVLTHVGHRILRLHRAMTDSRDDEASLLEFAQSGH